MRRRRMFSFILICLLGLTATSLVSAKQKDGPPPPDETVVIDNAETPYLDEDGNFDATMAKEFAERVNSYVDENGVAWDVWLDELGGQMWAETMNAKAASLSGASVSTDSESATSTASAGTMTIVIHLFMPNFIKVWRNGDTAVTYTRTGNDNGYIEYSGNDGMCGGDSYCSDWKVWVTASDETTYEEPENPTVVQGQGGSGVNYCGTYVGSYAAPPTGQEWHPATSQACYNNGSQYVFYTTGTEYFNGSTDYIENSNMVKWTYSSGGHSYRVIVQYGGLVPY